MAICNPIIIVPQQEGVGSTLQIIVKPKAETVTVMEIFPYDSCVDDDFPTHLVNDLFEAPCSAHELAKVLKDSELMTLDGVYDQCKCVVHLNHLLDREPILCPSLASALLVAKTVADHT